MPEQTDRFDWELDAALASYAQTSEIEGVERRVLAAATWPIKTRGMSSILRWAVAACVVVMGCWLLWRQQLNQPAIKQFAAKQLVTASSPPRLRSSPRHFAITLTHVTKPRRAWKNLTEPKLPQFPSPSPMTGEERALLRLAASGQSTVVGELTFGSLIESIQLKPLEIKPLE